LSLLETPDAGRPAARVRDTSKLVSEVADHFREAVHASLDSEHQELLVAAAGAGGDKELRRALLLSDRAVREWAARAAAHEQSGRQTAYQRLQQLMPERWRAVQEAAIAEQKTGLDAERELIAEMVWGIGERLAGIDTAASLASSQHSLNHMAVEAAEILLAAGRVLADPGWQLSEANEMLHDLVRPH
jgi:hypothetical protein